MRKAWSLLLLAYPAAVVAAPLQTTGKTIALPPMFVTANGPAIHWQYVAIPGFEILSACSEPVTAAFTRRVYLNQDLLDAIVPPDLQARESVPTTLIVLSKDLAAGMGRATTLAEDRRAETREALEKYGTPVPDRSGMFPQVRLEDADSAGADVILDKNTWDFEFDPEYVFFALRERRPQPPLWFVEGILNFRYPEHDGNFEIRRLRYQRSMGNEPAASDMGPGSETDVEVNVHPSSWISPGIRNWIAQDAIDSGGFHADYGATPGAGGGPPSYLRLIGLLDARMGALGKVLTEPPPAPGDQSASREYLSIRKLFREPAPPWADSDARTRWMHYQLETAGLLPAHANATQLNRILGEFLSGQSQVKMLMERGAETGSPWRREIWNVQSYLLARRIFNGMSIRTVLTEPAPAPSSDSEKNAWFAHAGLAPGSPSKKSHQDAFPKDPAEFHRLQLILTHGTDPGSPWLLDIWKAQAALFVRWAFDDPSQARRESLWKLARYASTGAITEPVFRQIFGMGFDEMTEHLLQYLPRALTETFVLFPAGSFTVPNVEMDTYASHFLDFGNSSGDLLLRDPTKAERARVLGDWERKEIGLVRNNDPEYVDLYSGQAEDTLLDAYSRGERDPGLVAALGLYECDVRRDDRAIPFLEAAVDAHVARPAAYVQLARIRLEEALARPAGPAGSLDGHQVASVLNLLQPLRSLRPPQLAGYLLAASAWEHSDAIPSPGDIHEFDDALYFFPNDPRLILADAQLCAAAGLRAKAVEVLDRGLLCTSDPKIRDTFLQLKLRYGDVR